MRLLQKMGAGVSKALRVAAAPVVAAVSATPLVSHAQASGVDYTSLTSSVSFSTTITAVMAVAASLVLLYVAIKGAKIVLRMIRSA
ncbi:major capsid protein [Trinickia dinghuensis]|uniref:Phage coat protein n=1 Tax=Trinickia dinghuensis TaxID=2291023 RepID=A0A3D8JUD1_9BURK|nr:major capsid protein [Trinickia dinghuensis]RDU96677.1 hypothetical protein DWV00_22000 [Trinickia dinghuensis]